MRLPNAVERVGADDRVQRHAGLARARADLADELALQRLLVELALAGHDRARGAHPRVEVERVEDERRARLQRRAAGCPEPAAQPARGAGHRHAARIARQAGRRAGRAAPPAARRARRRRPSAGRRRRARARTACGRRTTRRCARRRRPPCASIASSAPAPPSVVAEPPTPTSTTCAPASTAAQISSPGAVRGRRPGVALVLGDQAEAGRRRHLEHGRAAVLDQPELRLDRPPERIGHLDADRLAAQRQQDRLHRALAAVRQRAQVGRHQPGPLEPATDRAGDLRGAERALERVRRDEHGALQHRRILPSFAPSVRRGRATQRLSSR